MPRSERLQEPNGRGQVCNQRRLSPETQNFSTILDYDVMDMLEILNLQLSKNALAVLYSHYKKCWKWKGQFRLGFSFETIIPGRQDWPKCWRGWYLAANSELPEDLEVALWRWSLPGKIEIWRCRGLLASFIKSTQRFGRFDHNGIYHLKK